MLVDFIEYYIFQVIMARTVVPRFSIMLLISCVNGAFGKPKISPVSPLNVTGVFFFLIAASSFSGLSVFLFNVAASAIVLIFFFQLPKS